MRNVFIITRCFDLACKESALLVFNTIRVGFPNWPITCIYLGDFDEIKSEIEDKCKIDNITFRDLSLSFQTNDEVIEWLVKNEQQDFLVCDSDMIFWKSLEFYQPINNLAGRHIPRYSCEFTNTLTEERLHTSLLYFSNLPQLRLDIENSFKQLFDGRFTPYNPYKPVITKFKGQSLFYDSCCILYHAIGGEAFGKDILDCYDHLHAGSFYKEIVNELKIPDKQWTGAFSHPESVKGSYRKQRVHWFKSAFKKLEENYTNKLSEDAQTFLYGFGKYVGLIDDLIDEPANAKLVSETTAYAARLFSSNYWTVNSRELLIVEQLVHVIYFTQLKWETDIEAWKRRDARVLNHCGYYLILAVFLLETRNVKLTEEFADILLEINHAEHLEDLTMEEQRA